MRIYSTEILDKVGEEVELAGWVDSRRDHGKLIFIDLRDKEGLVQLVFSVKDEELRKQADELRPEWVIRVRGKVVERPEEMKNPNLKTGNLEVAVSELEILAKAETPPFPLDSDGYEINEELRLKYRYLDLRRQRLKRNLVIRHQAAQFVRKFLSDRGFTEIETPYITKGTPEGAREFVMPARLHPGKFYVLPQSPQQFKQLLMVAGLERYFQLARVFRDEDPRADRAYGEATQIDIEVSFMSQEEILSLVEEMFLELVKVIFPEKRITQVPFPRIPYDEAMEKYKTDKPDLRENREDPNELAFCFIVDWPMFEWNEEEKRWDPHHHIFTAPRASDIPLLDSDPAKVRSWQHDLVLDGYEIAGGSIRITDPEVQAKVFELVGIPKEEGRSRFEHMLEAFGYGVPPHGGIAIGFDRMLIPLLNEPNLREVMAFPKTGDGRDLMMGAPSTIEERQLKELKIRIEDKRKNEK
ncbi:MAG TPA: amino acid--tRNA ligase-related protein [Candidatus Paceibacterota bacterium]